MAVAASLGTMRENYFVASQRADHEGCEYHKEVTVIGMSALYDHQELTVSGVSTL